MRSNKNRFARRVNEHRERLGWQTVAGTLLKAPMVTLTAEKGTAMWVAPIQVDDGSTMEVLAFKDLAALLSAVLLSPGTRIQARGAIEEDTWDTWNESGVTIAVRLPHHQCKCLASWVAILGGKTPQVYR